MIQRMCPVRLVDRASASITVAIDSSPVRWVGDPGHNLARDAAAVRLNGAPPPPPRQPIVRPPIKVLAHDPSSCRANTTRRAIPPDSSPPGGEPGAPVGGAPARAVA